MQLEDILLFVLPHAVVVGAIAYAIWRDGWPWDRDESPLFSEFDD